MDLPDLAAQVRSNNVNASLGRVMEGEQRYLVRAVGEFRSPEEIGALPLKNRQLRLEDLGRVNYDYPEKREYDRLNGVDAVSMRVFKSSTATVVEVAQAAAAALKQIEAEYNGQLEIEVIQDDSKEVLREAGNLVEAALLGACLAVGIIFLFLRNLRSTLAIALAIPVSLCCVFTCMYLAREAFDSAITLNMVSMMGLMLSLGIMVDPAVVTLESIFRKREEEGEGPVEAALSGSREIGMAVLASALTTTCVFIPFFFLSESRAVLWMRDAGLTICLAILVSVAISLSVIPLASAYFFKDEYRRFEPWLKGGVLLLLAGLLSWKLNQLGWAGVGKWADTWAGRIAGMEWTGALALGVVAALAGLLGWQLRQRGLRTTYVRFLGWSLDHRFATLAVTVGLLALGVYSYMKIEQHGTPTTPERQVDIAVEIDRSYSMEEIRELFVQIEQTILAHKEELDVEWLDTEFALRRGEVEARLVSADAGRLTTAEATEALRKLLPQKVGVRYKVGRQRSWGGLQLGVEVQLVGRDPAVLGVLAEEVKTHLERLPGVQDVDTSLEDGEEEVIVAVNRDQAAEHGLSSQQVASAISTALGTRRTTTFKAGEREIDVVLQLEEEDRVNLEQLQNSSFAGRQGARVQLASLADFDLREGPQSLSRANRQLIVTVSANTADRAQALALTEPISKMMAQMALPQGYSWNLGRAARWFQQDTQSNHFAMLFAVLLIYLIMASLFESLIHPLTIMLAIPFSFIGVALGLYALSIPLDNNGMLGLLILCGIVVNNGIVLIDHINHYRREGMDRRQAILLGGQHRMRPILMTAFSTILNLMPMVLPMVYGAAEGFAQQWGPVGLVVVCGLATSTLLTLVLAPTLYSLLDDLGLWLRRVVHASRAH